MHKTIVIIFTLLLMVSMTACPTCGGGADPQIEYFHLIGFEPQIRHIERNVETKSINYQKVTDTIFYNHYTIYMYPKTKYVGVGYHFSLIPAAYACVPPPIQQSDETIENIEIITHQDFDSTHLAGSNIIDLFKILDPENVQEEYSIDEYLKKYPNPHRNGISFLLRKSPHQTGEYSFSFKYYQSGGEVEYIEVQIDKNILII
ncbi:MAG: hypothetical protein GY828_01770 [Candidatus Gracilibacteria bacterium]|nr:hypothetical protein [Candidatus Gracilibacteria bacterium]